MLLRFSEKWSIFALRNNADAPISHIFIIIIFISIIAL